MQIHTQANNIIYTREKLTYDDIPFFFPYVTSEKKKRPKRTPLDKNVPRMVTIKELSNLTGISEYCIRKLYKQDKLIHIKSGSKVYINYDKFIDYMNGTT